MLKGIFEQLVEGHQLPKKLAQDLLAGMVESVTRHLKQGDRIRIGGLGTLEVRQREARAGRNPATGEAMQIAASKKVVKSLATAPPISRAIATPLGLDRALRDGVCGCWEAVGKWPAGATVESLA